jgi:transcriptional regulator with XRE-family HTH domain
VQEKYDRAEIGRRIKRLRQSQDMTVQELARRSQVSAGYVSEVERGLSGISVDKLSQIANGLKVGVDTFLAPTSEGSGTEQVVVIPAALSAAADRLNLTHRATLKLLQGKMSLTARRSKSDSNEWTVDDWLRFHDQVKDYLADC